MELKKELRCYLLYGLLFVLLIIRVHFSLYNGDESYYLAMTNRIVQGDLLLIDEWSNAQFFTLVLFPFMYVYKCFVPSLEGVYLYFRIIMITYMLFTAINTYRSLRGENKKVAFVSGIVFLLYARGNNLGMSYYNVFLLSAWNSFILLINVDESVVDRRHNMYGGFVAGFFSAIAVLSMPYFVLLVIAIWVCVLFRIRKRKELIYVAFTFVLGAFVVALPTILMLVRPLKNPLLEECLYNILHNSRAGISGNTILSREIKSLGETLTLCLGIGGKLAYIRVGLLFIAFAILLFSRKKNVELENKILLSIVVLLCLSRMLTCVKHIGWVQVVFSFYCFPLLLDLRKKNIVISKSIYYMYVFGGLLSICFIMGSDQRLECITIGAVVQFISSLFIFETYFKELGVGTHKYYEVGENVFIISLLVIMMITRFLGVCGDADLNKLTYRIEDGPWKGVYTTELQKQNYCAVLETISGLKKYKDEATVLYSTILPWAYLCSDYRYATNNEWKVEINSQDLIKWCEIHDKYPDICVIFNQEIGGNEGSKFNVVPDTMSFNENNLSGTFWEMLNNDYKIQYETECARVYIKE